MDDELDLSRRNFMLAGTTSLMALSGSGPMQVDPGQFEGQPIEEYEFQGVADLIGPSDARPDPGDPFFDNKIFYAYRYVSTRDGARSFITQEDDSWSELPTHLVGYAVGDLPTDVDSGTLVFDTNRGLPSWWDRDHYERPNFVDNRDVLITPETVANTTTETQVFSIGFNEDSMVQGRVYQLDLMGTFGTTNNSDMFTIGIDLGGVEIATLSNEPANATGVPWSMETTYTVRSHGQSGEVQPHTRGVFNSITKDDHHPTATVDTTVTEMLSVTITWTAADPANTVTLEQAHLKQMA